MRGLQARSKQAEQQQAPAPTGCLPFLSGGVECSAAQLRPEGRKEVSVLIPKGHETLGFSNEINWIPPGTFLGRLDGFQVFWCFQKHQQEPKRLCYLEQKPQPSPGEEETSWQNLQEGQNPRGGQNQIQRLQTPWGWTDATLYIRGTPQQSRVKSREA